MIRKIAQLEYYALLCDFSLNSKLPKIAKLLLFESKRVQYKIRSSKIEFATVSHIHPFRDSIF